MGVEVVNLLGHGLRLRQCRAAPAGLRCACQRRAAPAGLRRARSCRAAPAGQLKRPPSRRAAPAAGPALARNVRPPGARSHGRCAAGCGRTGSLRREEKTKNDETFPPLPLRLLLLPLARGEGVRRGERSCPFLFACALKGRLRAEGARCANLTRGGQHTRASPPPLRLHRPLPRTRRGGYGYGMGMCPSPPEPWRHQAGARSSWQVCAPSPDGFRGGEGSRCGDVLLSKIANVGMTMGR